MKIDNNTIIIDDFENEDYQLINSLLIKRDEIDTLKITNSNVNFDMVDKYIKGSNVKSLIINDCYLSYDNYDFLNIDSLIIEEVRCDDFEFFIKLNSLRKLEIKTLTIPFDCYYLRKLDNLQALKLYNIQPIHLGGLGYLSKLNVLELDKVNIKSWVFITKIEKLKTLYISSDYDVKNIPFFNIKLT